MGYSHHIRSHPILHFIFISQHKNLIHLYQKVLKSTNMAGCQKSYRVHLESSSAIVTSCSRCDTICPARCTPDSAAHLQPIPYACGAQRALIPIAVGAMNINELLISNDVRESATLFPRPCKLTFDILTLKVVSESRVTCAISVCQF